MENKVIDPRGYVLIYVGKKHHLADVRGYAYEHRLVAERILGRRLKPEEEVHHKNTNPSDNSESNIKVAKNHAEHLFLHRTNHKKRKPWEPNPLVFCDCGCGRSFNRFDEYDRPRKYFPGCSWRKGTGKRNSAEMILCECGCRTSIKKYDSGARPRRFVSGHNGRKS